eukprot:CFRG3031T1
MKDLVTIYEKNINQFSKFRIRGRHIVLSLIDAYYLFALEEILESSNAKNAFTNILSQAFPKTMQWPEIVLVVRALPSRAYELNASIKWYGKLHILLRREDYFHYLGLWLSTLGGAHSALGEADRKHAFLAYCLGIRQMQVSRRLGNVYLEYFCLLYTSYGLIQLHEFKAARKTIEKCWVVAKTTFKDEKFIRSCQAAWLKLREGLVKSRSRKLYKLDSKRMVNA